MKLFISSTIYDLLDVRSEIFGYLNQIGYEVRMSEVPISQFEFLPDTSSIEMCLENVRRSNYVIVILDQRYGPSLEKVGYDEISATHLEYREAIRNSIPVIMFVRDRTSAEYSTFKKQKGKLEGSWVTNGKDQRLFDILNEHSKLKGKKDNNWYYTFTSSLDLKTSIHNILRIPFLTETLPKRIAEGIVPLLTVDHKIETLDGKGFKVTVIASNRTNQAAFVDRMSWKKNSSDTLRIVQPGEDIFMGYLINAPLSEAILFLEYRSYDGISVCEEYISSFQVNRDGTIRSKIEPNKRQFTIGDPVQIDIQ